MGCEFLKRLSGEGLGTCPNLGLGFEVSTKLVSEVSGTVHVPEFKG